MTTPDDTTPDDLDQLLWDYIYGLLEPAKARALEARITSDHDVARAYAETRQRADMLGKAARVLGPRIKLLPPEEPLSPPAKLVAPTTDMRRGLGWSWLLASAALVLAGLVGYAYCRHIAPLGPGQLAHVEHQLASDYHRVLVTGPAQVQPWADNLYTVQVEDLNGIAVADAKLLCELTDGEGAVVQQQVLVADADGHSSLSIAGRQVLDDAKLRVWAESTDPATAAELSIARGTALYETSFNFNKATYRPGETVFYRTVTLPAFSEENQREFHWDFGLTTNGAIASPLRGATDQGVGNGKVTLADDLSTRSYALVAAAGEPLKPLTATVPVSGDRLALQPQVQLLHKDMADGTTTGVRVAPEGGYLVAGLENKVFFAVPEPHRFDNLHGKVLDSSAKEVAEVMSDGAGKGEFTFTPVASESYKLALADDRLQELVGEVPLPAVVADIHAKLSSDSTYVAAGAPIKLQVATTKAPAQLLVAATRGGAHVGQQFVEFDAGIQCPASQRVSLALIDEVDGAVDVTLYDVDQSPPLPISQYLCFRQPARYLNVALEPQTGGDRWNVRVVDELRCPTAAVLGVNVVAESAAPLVANEQDKLTHWRVAATSAPVTPPLLVDNLTQVKAAYERAVTQWRDHQQDRVHSFAFAIGMIALLLLILVAMLATLRLAGEARGWFPATGMAIASLVIACAWLRAWPEPQLTIAARPVKAYVSIPSDATALGVDHDLQQVADSSVTSAGVGGSLSATISPAGGPDGVADAPLALPLVVADPTSGPTPPTVAFDTFGVGNAGSGWGGGGLGGGAGGALGEYGVLDRLQARDFYSAEIDQTALATTDDLARQTKLGSVVLNYSDYTALPVVRYSAIEPTKSPTSASPVDKDVVYWDPLVKTSAQGEAELRFTLPPSGRYRIMIDAHGNGRRGTFQQVIERNDATQLPAPVDGR